MNVIIAIEQDIHNFGAIIHKQFILWEYVKKNENYPVLQDLYITEVEYLMGLIRSFFDLLYEVFKLILSLSKHQLSELPKTLGSFSDRVHQRSKQNEELSGFLKSSYGFNDILSDFFSDILPLFRLCRKIRDSIYHRGKTPQIIFITENGPAIGMRKIGKHKILSMISESSLKTILTLQTIY